MKNYFLITTLLFVIACGADKEQPSTAPANGKSPETGGVRSEPAPAKAIPAAASKSDDDLSGDMYIDPPKELVDGLGVDVYPGVRVFKYLTSVKGTDEKHPYRDVIFYTHDPASKVNDFYKQHLPEAKPVGEMLQGLNVYVLEGKNAAGETVRIQAQTMKDVTHIHVITTSGT